MTVCKRCGFCCHFKDEHGKVRKCKHLVKLKNRTTLCRIWSKRLGQVIYERNGLKIHCSLRKDSAYDYPGCDFNTNKPIFGGINEN